MKAGNGGEISVNMALNGESNPNKVMNIGAEPNEVYFVIQVFLDFSGFDFRNLTRFITLFYFPPLHYY